MCAVVVLGHAGYARSQPADFATAQSKVFQFNQAGDYRQALAWAERALQIAERDHGPLSMEAAIANLAIAIQNQSLGQLPPAAEHFRRGLAIAERRVPADDPSLASFVAGLGGMLYGQGRYDEAEPHLRRSVRLQEILARQTGNEAGLAVAIYMLGTNYSAMSRLDEGNSLLVRALAAFERLAPQGSLQIGVVLNNLATNRQLANDFNAAAQYQLRALQLFQTYAADNLPGLAKINNNLGFLHARAGLSDKAAGYYRDALAQLRRAFPAGHPDVATASINYGGLLLQLERPGEAEPLLTSALAMRKRWLPPDHPEIAQANAELANLWIRRGDWRRAVEQLRGAVDIFVSRAARQDSGRGSAAGNDVARNAFAFSLFVKAEHRRAPSDIGSAFATAQHAVGSSGASSLAQMATRSAAGDPRLSALVRARQDLVAQWHALDRELVATLSKPTPQEGAGEPLRQRLAGFDTQITELDRTIAAEFPDFIALANPAPLNIADVQADLSPDEALVLFLDTAAYLQLPEETFVWIVTKSAARKVRSNLGTEALSREVAALRCGLDKTAWDGEGAVRCATLLGMALEKTPVDGQPLPFDHTRAHHLYTSLFGAAADLVKDKHLLIVPSGPLTQLPFQVLVTRPPKGGNHRSVAWLARDHAITILPAAASLRSLRRVGRPSAAPRPMIGFGNPLLDGPDPRYARSAAMARDRQHCPRTRWHQDQAQSAPRSSAKPVPTQNGLAVQDHLRIQVPLPETADELCAVAQDMRSDAADIHLGAQATEHQLKRLSTSGELAKYRMVHFATHGLLAGQLDGTSEPGLILTPPTMATDDDDGYLSASEIAALKLDADLVILSACNTAAGAATSAEALSGLARAFIYAQTRALLVSHWEVFSDATVKLITTAMREMARDPKVGRAEAVRRSMIALIDKGAPHEAHPAYWAPFVVVGEGAARRQP